jgi:hypothetical protein
MSFDETYVVRLTDINIWPWWQLYPLTSSEFDVILDNLKSAITHIYEWYHMGSPYKNYLPYSLTYLSTDNFTSNTADYLPLNVTTIIIYNEHIRPPFGLHICNMPPVIKYVKCDKQNYKLICTGPYKLTHNEIYHLENWITYSN